jgi:pyruvate,orthophosphate dikinase
VTDSRARAQDVYFFGGGRADGHAGMKSLLGSKGANLAEMTALGVPVPPGFTISTAVCLHYRRSAGSYPDGLRDAVAAALRRVEELVAARFGDAENPLLVSVRSGAAISMPGMMDTVLNLGLNDRTAAGLAARTSSRRFVEDSHRRFIQMYSGVVLGMDGEPFEEHIDELKEKRGVILDTELDADDLASLKDAFRAMVKDKLGRPFPEDPEEQLWEAIAAVFRSWDNRRAVQYRAINGIPDDLGTAVNVQAMVFGNLGEGSGTGVAFTRDANTGARRFFGEWLPNAQGEDVVAGIRTPAPILAEDEKPGGQASLERAMPGPYRELRDICDRLERHYTDMQDIEFTVQEGKLWMLQTRTGKRTAAAAVKIAVDLCREGLIDKGKAVLRVDPASLDQLLHPTLDPAAKSVLIARGLAASPGAASGAVVFSSDEAEARAKRGDKVVLVRVETSPEDIHGMHAAQGILTARGGMTSHAAVVARGMGKCCVAGCSEIKVDYRRKVMIAGEREVREGDVITLDGGRGLVFLGDVPRRHPELTADFAELMAWADETRRLRVRTNADTPHDAEVARRFGAEGIGLCRTEHMFFDEDRIDVMREMILASDKDARVAALEKLVPMQRGDFAGIFRAMAGLPVTIRLLDPPLHEFLPNEPKEVAALGARIGMPVDALSARIARLHEFNPMLGHRGCRLAVTFPEIYDAQVRAIGEACVALAAEGVDVRPEIMIPLVATEKELEILRGRTVAIMDRLLGAAGAKIPYTVGTMIELPRAALQAGNIARAADFFSFGTNDLTQTTFGLSRDDSGKFLPEYVAAGILAHDPFVVLEEEGVGELVRIGVERGRATKPGLKIGICGEHGGEPASVDFCHRVGLDYVSCSPYRVPIARLAAAQASLRHPMA